MTDTPFDVPLDLAPEARIAAAVDKFGESEVITRSLSLIDGNNEGEEFLLYVGGDHANGILHGAPALYWPELWGLRALLYVWSDEAAAPVTEALGNQAWRVREMAARVSALRGLPITKSLKRLLGDNSARVRDAATRAIGAVGSFADIDILRPLLRDPAVEVRRGANYGIELLHERFPDGAGDAVAGDAEAEDSSDSE